MIKIEKTTKITWEEKEVEVVQRPLNWGEIKEATEKSIVIKEYKGMPMQFKNTVLLDDLKTLKSIKSAPFEINMENFNKLTEADRYKLVTVMVALDSDKDVDTSKSN